MSRKIQDLEVYKFWENHKHFTKSNFTQKLTNQLGHFIIFLWISQNIWTLTQKDMRQKMTPLKIWDVLIKSWVLSPENGPHESALSFYNFLLFYVQNQGKTVGKNDLKKWLTFWLFYRWLKHDDLSQNLFLEVKKPEIKETKGTLIIQKLKSSYWGPFSGLKTQDLVKTSRIFSGVIFCRRSFGKKK